MYDKSRALKDVAFCCHSLLSFPMLFGCDYSFVQTLLTNFEFA